LPVQFCYCGAKMVEIQICKYQCPNCVPGSNILLGDNKQIADIDSGNMCIGVTGHVRIDKKFQRDYDGEILRIRATGLLPIDVTPEHPLLVVHSEVKQHRTVAMSAPEWRPAREIRPKARWKGGDYVVIPRIRGCVDTETLSLAEFTNEMGVRVLQSKHLPLTIPLDDASSWFLGMYVAEGWSSPKGVVFVLNKKETDFQDRIVKIGRSLGYSPYVRESSGAAQVGVPSRVLARALPTWCGSGAPNKHVPDFILLHKQDSILRSFLQGYLQGDGGVSRDSWIAATVSPVLGLQLQLLCARLGITASIRQVSIEGQSEILGKSVHVHDKYHVTLYQQSKQMRVRDDTILAPVKRVESSRLRGWVYNVATADGTFLASNAVVHNCGMLWDCEDVLGLPK